MSELNISFLKLLDILIECEPDSECFERHNKRVFIKSSKKNRKIRKILMCHFFSKQYILRMRIPKVSDYCKIIEELSDTVFHSHFRMSKNAFLVLVNQLEPFMKVNAGHPPTTLKEHLFMTLWALANQNSFRELSDRFNKAKSTSFDIVLKTCKLINKLSKSYVKWPTTPTEIEETVQEFNNLRRRGFPNVIGCIDGMHVAIKAPASDPSSYYNRKGFHSMILQAVCKSDGSFSNVFFGWPGRSHDAYVFQNSELKKSLDNQSIRFPDDVHMIGDSAYPLSTFLMVPYKDNGNLSSMQRVYNQALSSTRVVIEQSFRRLKSKFRILENINFKKSSNIKVVVLTCVILHNFILKEDNERIVDDEILNRNTEDSNEYVFGSGITIQAQEKRDALCHIINSG